MQLINRVIKPAPRTVSRVALLATLGGLLVSGAASAGAPGITPSSPRHASASGLPLSFEPNLGQATHGAEYFAHGDAYAIAVTGQGAELALGKGLPATRAADVIRLRVQGAPGNLKPAAENPLPGRVNYLLGNDRSQWHTNVATFGKIRYAGVYPGVDLVYYGTQGKLEYDFLLNPGARPDSIGLSFEGAQALRVDRQGNLKVRARSGEIAFLRPVAYQEKGGRRVPVAASYQLRGTTVRFNVGSYDHRERLIIDPVLSYFSYLGGNGDDVIGSTGPTGGAAGVGNIAIGSQGAAVDGSGNLYVAGYTFSTNFPTHSPAQAAAPTANPVAFVTKIAPDAKTLVYSTYLGGSTDDFAYAIAVDSTGNAFVVGMAGSNDFPVTGGAYQRLCSPDYHSGTAQSICDRGHNGPSNAFVSKFSPTGALLASTFLGGTSTQNYAWAVAVDSAGRPYVAGTTYPGENIPAGTGGFVQQVGFPTTAGAVVRAYDYCNGCNVNGALQQDAFVSVFDPTLSTLVYSTLVGDDQVYAPGNQVGNTLGTAVTVDSTGSFYVAGYTQDGFLPTTGTALQKTVASCGVPYPGSATLNGACGFVAKFSAVGASSPTLTYATYLGHMPNCCSIQIVAGIAADAAGDAYVVGYGDQTGFPTTGGAYQATCGGGCGNFAFIAELNPTGSQLLHSTYFGDLNASTDNVYEVGPIVLDSTNNVYVTGIAGSGLAQVNPLPVSAGGYASGPGNQAPFVAKLDPTLSTLALSTLVGDGGAGQNVIDGLALDSSGNIYMAGSITGITSSAATPGVFQTTTADPGTTGFGDGFVIKIAQTVATSTSLTASPTSANTGASIAFTATVTQASGSTVPTGTVTFEDGTTTLGTGTLNGTGVAMYSTTSLAAGAYSVTAVYGGDTANSGSTSTAAALTITTPPPPPPVPTVTISVSPTTITVGQSATITWSSTNATSCTASSAWTGTQATSGTMTATPSAAASLSYALACTGAGGSATGTAALTVNAAASSGGSTGTTGSSSSSGGSGKSGGGAMDVWTLLGLALLGLVRLRPLMTAVSKRGM